MDADLKNSSTRPCLSNDTLLETQHVLALMGGVGGIATIIGAVAIALILLFRVYKHFTDRLVLYIIIGAFLYSISGFLQLVGIWKDHMKLLQFNHVCEAMAYLYIYSQFVQVLVHVLMSVHLLLFATFQVKVSRFEVPIMIGIFVLPAAISAIPFITGSYGATIAWCWITSHGDTERVLAGFIEQMALGYASQILVTGFSSVVAVIVAVIICRRTRVSREHKQAVRQTFHLVMYPLIVELFCLISLTNRIVHYVLDDPYCVMVLWWLAAGFIPMKGVVITLSLLIHTFLAMWRRWKKRVSMEWTTAYQVPKEFSTEEEEPLIIRSEIINNNYELIFDN